MIWHFRSAGWTTALASIFALALAWPLRADEPFDYFRNSWSVIGLKDYEHGTRITPDNKLLLADESVQSTVEMRLGRLVEPLSRKQTKRLLDGWLPVILITANDGPVRYDITLWATPLPTVKGWQKAFDWPTEGENFLNWIVVKATNTGGTPAEAKVLVTQGRSPKLIRHVFVWSLAADGSEQAVVRIPYFPVEDASLFAKEDPEVWLQRTIRYWRGIMANAARIDVPCPKATQTLLASHVYQLIGLDHGEMHLW